MASIQTFRDLNVYRGAVREALAIFRWSLTLPAEERYELASQIRRSSRAVGALLAEAWGRRQYPRAFVEKLSQALAEANETRSWLDHARVCGYLDADTYETFDDGWDHISAMIRIMMKKSDRFCR